MLPTVPPYLTARRRAPAGAALRLALLQLLLSSAALDVPDRASAQPPAAPAPIPGASTWGTRADDDADYARDRVAAVTPWDETTFARTFSHHTEKIDGASLHYVVGGSGPPVLLIHGWPGYWYTWRRVMPALAARHTVIAVDLPGFGDSEAAPEADGATVADRLFALTRQLGYARVAVAAHDVGVWTAYAYAARHRDAVTRLALLESAVPGFGMADSSARDVLAFASTNGLWHMPFFMQGDVAAALVAGHERAFLDHMARGIYYNKDAFGEADLTRYVDRFSAPGAFRSSIRYYHELYRDAAENRETARQPLGVPVLVLNAAEGGLAAVTPGSVRGVAADVRAETVTRTGHFIPEERPVYLARRLLAFFGGAEPADGTRAVGTRAAAR